MPRHCSVAGCASNSKKSVLLEGVISTFKIPATKKEQYEEALGRELPKESFICVKHFEESYIVSKVPDVDSDDKVRPKLVEHALPTLALPQKSKCTAKRLRKDPECRRKEVEKRKLEEEKQNRKKFRLEDKIRSLDDLRKNSVSLSEFVNVNCNSWLYFLKEDHVTFVQINEPENEKVPTVTRCLRINKDLTIDAFFNSLPLQKCRFIGIVGKTGLCNTWGKLRNVLQVIESLEVEERNLKSRLEVLCKDIEYIEKNLLEDDELMAGRLKFVKEQIENLHRGAPRYSIDMIMFSCSIFYAYPSAYRKLRESGYVTLPHPTYLKRIEAQVTKHNSGFDDSHFSYIVKKCMALPPEHRYVVLLLDEIYCKPQFTYVGGRIYGKAGNKEQTTAATTVQAFMIRSMFSSYKDMVALFPVNNLSSEDLQGMIMLVIETLHKAGFKVVAVSSDNNRVNRKAFENICGGVMEESIEHPYEPSMRLFFLFDTVHNFKNVRNNWLNSDLPNQSFSFPHPQDGSIVSASFGHLKSLYNYERERILKLARGLSYKALFPSNIERQNMQLVVKIFNEQNIAALQELKHKLPNCVAQEVEGTIVFLQTMLRWWHVVNVKTPAKGIHKKNRYMERVDDVNCEQLNYLREFIRWLEKWDTYTFVTEQSDNVNAKKKKRIGKLTEETYFAMLHTTKALVSIAEYALKELKVTYILLGFLQTDTIERRFGNFRRMSGCCYHVSVAQIMQAERKIKVLSILRLAKTEGSSRVSLTELRDKANDSSSTYCDSNALEEAHDLEDAVVDAMDFLVDDDTQMVVVVVAGYAAHKAMQHHHCDSCIALLTDRLKLEVEIPKQILTCFENMDRGGLKIPTYLLFNLTLQCYKLFNTLISETYEKRYFSVTCQRAVFVSLAQNLFGMFDIEDRVCSQCLFPNC